MSLYSINIRLESIEKVELNIDALKRAIAVANEIDAALLTEAKNTLEILLSEVKGEVAFSILQSNEYCKYCCFKPCPGMHQCRGLRFTGKKVITCKF